MTALHTALSERCVAYGLPPLPGSPVDPAPLEEGAMLARADRIRSELARLPDLNRLNDRTRRAAEQLASELAKLEAEMNGISDEDLKPAAHLGGQTHVDEPTRRRRTGKKETASATTSAASVA